MPRTDSNKSELVSAPFCNSRPTEFGNSLPPRSELLDEKDHFRFPLLFVITKTKIILRPDFSQHHTLLVAILDLPQIIIIKMNK